MIAPPLRTRRARRDPRTEASRTLCAIVRCGKLAVAIPADAIAFIAAADVTTVAQRDGALHVKAGLFDAVGWLLHDELEVAGTLSSWLFLKPQAGVPGASALGCDECMTVQPLVNPDPLPRGIFRSGADAIMGAFRVDDTLIERGCSLVGIWIDPVRLTAGGVT